MLNGLEAHGPRRQALSDHRRQLACLPREIAAQPRLMHNDMRLYSRRIGRRQNVEDEVAATDITHRSSASALLPQRKTAPSRKESRLGRLVPSS